MIVRPTKPLPAAQVARRAGKGQRPCWLASPAPDDVGIGREIVACDPVRVVCGDDPGELERVWAQERATWGTEQPEVPIGVGFLSYELGHQFERVRRRPRPASPWPLIEFRFFDAFWELDAAGNARVVARDEAAADRMAARLSPDDDEVITVSLGPLLACEPGAQHLAHVARVLTYLHAGDVYQVNLARRLAAQVPPTTGATGWALAARLRAEAPAPYALWMADGQRALIGNSPERFLRLFVDRQIQTSPIKGTRPRGTGAQDGASAAQLQASAKDRAEHVMIVDLQRNDLGRVCETGSVRVRELMRLLSFPTVHHLVSTVEGTLRPEVGLLDLLRATFPGGSITGAPKVRAMEIIDELEPAPRGPYTGATGWLGAAGDLELAVAIRTATIDDGSLLLWVGGGIVADSIPEDELRETDTKAAAFARMCSQPT